MVGDLEDADEAEAQTQTQQASSISNERNERNVLVFLDAGGTLLYNFVLLMLLTNKLESLSLKSLNSLV